jgi:hypothetical protein
MNRIIFIGLILLFNNAFADAGDQYLIGKAGIMTIDANDADPLISLGAYYGYGITPDITAEAELNLGLLGGDWDIGTDSGDYKVWTLAGYGVYRLPLGKVAYAKLKGGLMYESVTNNADSGKVDDTSFGITGGAGAGFILQNGMTLEAEATVIEQDIIFYSIGMHYPLF